MLRFKADDPHNFLDWLADLKGRVDAAEVVRAQLLQVEEVLYHKCQKALTRTVNVQRLGEFLLNGIQSFFEAIRTEVFRTDHLNEVADLAHQHIHD